LKKIGFLKHRVFRVLQESLYLKLIKAYYKAFVITHYRAIRPIKHESLASKHFSESLYIYEEQLFSHFSRKFSFCIAICITICNIKN